MRFVALLRGINVGPSTQVGMTDLQRAFVAAGYPDAVTLLRSGNVVFSAPDVDARARAALEERIRLDTGTAALVLVVPGESFRTISAANPLLEIATDPSRLLVTFLEEPPPADLQPPDADALEPERIVVAHDAVYQWCPLGVSKSRVPASFQRRLGPRATARNQNTVVKILAAL
jgi:uncharacterized protein (DUF1697 family)